MPCPVEIDTARKERQDAADDAETEWQSIAADKLATAWYHEYEVSGRVDHIGLELVDVGFYLRHGTASDIFELLADFALREVKKNPQKYKPEPVTVYGWN